MPIFIILVLLNGIFVLHDNERFYREAVKTGNSTQRN